MNIALLGYGTVGKSVEEILQKMDAGIRIKRILRRPGKADGPLMTERLSDILEDPDVSCVVEALSGKEPAFSYIREALSAGKHVVSSNKAALAADLPGLLRLAKKHGVSLLYEASCGGGIPWLENIKKAAKLDRITALSGILNGTGNYILDHMEREGAGFSEVLSSAQRLGYAEADPTADIGGYDLFNKALISCTLAYGSEITAAFPVAGIELLTGDILKGFLRDGKHLRFMMRSVRRGDRYAVGVAPMVLSAGSIEANVHENFNCATLCGDLVGELKFYGQGAGGYPTADAVVQDLILLRDQKAEPVVLGKTLCYEEDLLFGIGHFPDGTRCGTLSELCRMAKAEQVFMAFEEMPRDQRQIS